MVEYKENKKREINYRVFDKVVNFYTTYLKRNADLHEIEESGFNFWFYHKFRIYFDVRNCSYELDLIRSLQKDYNEIEVFGNNVQTKEVLKKTEIAYHIIAKPKRSLAQLGNFALITFIRFTEGIFRSITFENKILILDNKENYAKIRKKGNGIRVCNAQIDYLLSVLDKNEAVLLDKFAPPAIGQNLSIRSSYIKRYYPFQRIMEESILYAFTNFKWRKKAREISDSIAMEVNAIQPLDELDEIVLNTLKSLSRSTAYFCWKFLCYKRFFSRNKPEVMLITDEYSANTRLTMEAACANGIPVVSFQHGSMHELHPGYVYANGDPVNNVTPDIIIVWGPRWRSFLQGMNYPEERIKIGGQLRTDIIPEISSSPKSPVDIFGERVKGKEILLFASQPQRDISLKRKTALEVFESAKRLPETVLVVKLHPVEFDVSYYERIAESTGCTNYIIVKDLDLYELISISKAVITSFSTVGTEAVYFNKPVLIFDPLKQDVLGLIREGVAIQCVNSDDLTASLLKILKGEFMPDENRVSDFIKNQVFAIDGNTGQRYREIIRGLQVLS